MSLQELTEKQAITILQSPALRAKIRKEFLGWCVIYISHYLSLPPADFHSELMRLLSDASVKFLSIIGFRGSAKSSYGSMALPIYLALEKPNEYPFIIVVNETQDQVVENIANIRRELEQNPMILKDYGDMSEGISKQQEWNKTTILLRNGVKILGLSRGQRIRGRRHRQFRPSIAIIDDPEETTKVDKKQYRDKTERWLRGEVMPAIEESSARLIVLGNILHTDAIMMRLKNDSLFLHKDYSLFKGEEKWENCTWKGKYPTQESLDLQKQKTRGAAWLREYCLKVVPPEGQIIKEEWLHYYENIPAPVIEKGEVISNPILSTAVGVDLAISKKETADMTAMTSGVQALDEGRAGIYILPTPVNLRLNFQETIAQAKSISQSLAKHFSSPLFFVEDVGYQRAAVEMMQAAGIPARSVKVGTDKRARLMQAAIFIQNGTVKFPKHGCEDLISQLVGFGVEDHDDLVDSFVHLVLGVNNATGMQPLDIIQIL